MKGQIDMWRNRSPFGPTVLERIDELFAGGVPPAPPAIVVFVDRGPVVATGVGGRQPTMPVWLADTTFD